MESELPPSSDLEETDDILGQHQYRDDHGEPLRSVVYMNPAAEVLLDLPHPGLAGGDPS